MIQSVPLRNLILIQEKLREIEKQIEVIDKVVIQGKTEWGNYGIRDLADLKNFELIEKNTPEQLYHFRYGNFDCGIIFSNTLQKYIVYERLIEEFKEITKRKTEFDNVEKAKEVYAERVKTWIANQVQGNLF